MVSPAVSSHELRDPPILHGNSTYAPGTTNIAPIGENITGPVTLTGVLLTHALSAANHRPHNCAQSDSMQHQANNWGSVSSGSEFTSTGIAGSCTSQTRCAPDVNRTGPTITPSTISAQEAPMSIIKNIELHGMQSTASNDISFRLYNSCPFQVPLCTNGGRLRDHTNCGTPQNTFQKTLPTPVSGNQFDAIHQPDSCYNPNSIGLHWQLLTNQGKYSTTQNNTSMSDSQQSASGPNRHPSVTGSSDRSKLDVQVLMKPQGVKTHNADMTSVHRLQTQPADQTSSAWICPHCCAIMEMRSSTELQAPISNLSPRCDNGSCTLRETITSAPISDYTTHAVQHISLEDQTGRHGEASGLTPYGVATQVYSDMSSLNGQRNPSNWKLADDTLTDLSRQQRVVHATWRDNTPEINSTLDSFASSGREMEPDRSKVNREPFSGQDWLLTEETFGKNDLLHSMPMRFDLTNMLTASPRQRASTRDDGGFNSVSHDFSFESPPISLPSPPKALSESYSKLTHLQSPQPGRYLPARFVEHIHGKPNICGINTSHSVEVNNTTSACGDITKQRPN